MVTRFKHTVLITLLLTPLSSPAMEQAEEAYAEYMVVMTNGLGEDYETLASEFSEEDTPSQEALDKYPSYKLEREEEVFSPFGLIRELLREKRGHEKRITLPTLTPSYKLLGVLLTFEDSVPVTAFPDKQFNRQDTGPSRQPTIIAGREAIAAYRLSLAQQPGEGFQPGSSPPHPDDHHGLLPWRAIP